MFLLVSGRHVGAHRDVHQHGVSIQISLNLGKKFFRSCIRKIAVLVRVFAYLPSFFSQILDLIYRTVLILVRLTRPRSSGSKLRAKIRILKIKRRTTFFTTFNLLALGLLDSEVEINDVLGDDNNRTFIIGI